MCDLGPLYCWCVCALLSLLVTPFNMGHFWIVRGLSMCKINQYTWKRLKKFVLRCQMTVKVVFFCWFKCCSLHCECWSCTYLFLRFLFVLLLSWFIFYKHQFFCTWRLPIPKTKYDRKVHGQSWVKNITVLLVEKNFFSKYSKDWNQGKSCNCFQFCPSCLFS